MLEGLLEEGPRAACRLASDERLELKPNSDGGSMLEPGFAAKSNSLFLIMCVVVSRDAGMNVSEEMCRGREWGIGCASVSGSWTSRSKMSELSAREL